ncbi:hypothetical protein ACIP79_07735 [Streptomyces sp. NPDC088747]|uniref:hypothetical protein n=1 Tax=Streptomyces sp. NPDC088747 TaxID=3365886 RepID=UPI00382EABE0
MRHRSLNPYNRPDRTACSRFAVEHTDATGTTLVVTTNQPHASNWFGREAKPVLPSDVARTIQQALRDGWTPTAPGPPYHLDESAGFTPSP